MSSYYMGSGKFGSDWILISAIVCILGFISFSYYQIIRDIKAVYDEIETDTSKIAYKLDRQQPISPLQKNLSGLHFYHIENNGYITLQFTEDMADHSGQSLYLHPKTTEAGIIWICSESVNTGYFGHNPCITP